LFYQDCIIEHDTEPKDSPVHSVQKYFGLRLVLLLFSVIWVYSIYQRTQQ